MFASGIQFCTLGQHAGKSVFVFCCGCFFAVGARHVFFLLRVRGAFFFFQRVRGAFFFLLRVRGAFFVLPRVRGPFLCCGCVEPPKPLN